MLDLGCAMTFFGCNVLNANSLKCVSMDNEECKIRLQVINIDSNEPSFYPYSVKINKCNGSCNNATDDTYAKLCVYDVVKNINVKLFNLVPRTNETQHIEWHEPCKLNVD